MNFKKILVVIATCFVANVAKSQSADEPQHAKEKYIEIEHIVVTLSSKENTLLNQLPASVSIIGKDVIDNKQSQTLKDAIAGVPNFYIPDYGAKITSATYIRGIGSRMNTPVIGLYVDNIPYLDKSTFDFDFFDIDRIEVISGAQGTLYGRNAIGGIVNIYTLSPIDYEGTNVNLSAANNNTYKAQVSHYAKIGKYFGISGGASYNRTNGFFRNVYNNSRADKSENYGGRVHFVYQRNRFKSDLSVDFDHVDQNAFPYFLCDAKGSKISPISNNDPNDYRRKMFTSGLSMQNTFDKFTLVSTTGFQYFDDKMNLDQDFSPKSIFSLTQTQRQNAISQEIILKSNGTLYPKNFQYQWLFGVFGFYQNLNTDGPVTFKKDGINTIIQPVFDRLHASGAMPFPITVKSDEILIGGSFKTPTTNGAIFHQSTFNNVLTEGLSVTAGLRLDYEKVKVDYFSSSSMTLGVKMPGREVIQVKNDTILGKNSKNHVQLLPKFAIKYSFDEDKNIYISVAKGYKAGGYNIQMFSDLMQEKMASRTPIQNGKVNKVISYKPEHNWNFEIGSRSNIMDNCLQGNFALFYIRSNNQQIVQFAPKGFGRMMKNAGRSTSYGAELSLNAKFSESFDANISYGYTHSTFDVYNDTVRIKGVNTPVNYKGNYIPMVPQHTIMLAFNYIKNINSEILDKIKCHLQYYGYGKTYWTEQNNAMRGYYATMNGKISFIRKNCEISVWSKNILNKKYNSFYFELMGNSFAQRARGFQFGVDLALKF